MKRIVADFVQRPSGASTLSVIVMALTCAAAQADARTQDSQQPLRALFPSAEARAEQERTRWARQLERALVQLPNVQRAQVQLELPVADRWALDQPLPAAGVQLALELTGPGPDDAQIQRLVGSLVPVALKPVAIARSRPPATRAAHRALQRVGPFEVAAHSAGALRATLVLSLLANVGLATFVLVRWRRSVTPHPTKQRGGAHDRP
jgi:hypothetical protein